MRYTIFAAIVLTAGIVTPALATKNQTSTAPEPATTSGPSWSDCEELAWIRGVHTEQGELPDFVEQCTAGQIPFGEDFARYYKRYDKKKFPG
jgi:hypothetical protein